MSLIENAQARAAAYQPKRIDYARMQEVWPQQKRDLAAAVKTGVAENVAQVCVRAMNTWDEIGAWPDDWSLFQRALDDVLPWNQQVRLEDLR